MLSIGMRAEMSQANPNLDCLFSEAGWVTMELYWRKTHRTSTGGWLCQTNSRPAHMDTANKIMNWIIMSCAVVDLVTELENTYEAPW